MPIPHIRLQSTGFRQYWTISLFMHLLLFFMLPVSSPAKEVISITNGSWPPYLSNKLPHYGFASHVVSEAFALVGISVEYGFFPWKRSYAYAKAGEDVHGKTWNGTVIWVYTEERAKDFLYSDPVIIDTEILFHLKSKPLDWKVVEDLQGKTIGGTLHTAYPLFEEAEKRGILKISRGGNYNILFKKLYWRDVDAVPQVKHVGRYFLNTTLTEKERNQIAYSPTVVQERKYHLLLSKQIPENIRLLKLFNEGLQKLRTHGRYDALHKELEQGKYDMQLSEEALKIYRITSYQHCK